MSAFIADDTNLQAISKKLDKWRNNNPQEKVYLHLNKSFFLLGDTMYCKAYIVNAEGNMPSSISNIVYVDVIDNNKQVLKTMLLPVSDGIAWSAIAVNNLFHQGDYHIRAYTNWMRNFDNDFFFDKTITVLDGANKKLTATSLTSVKSQVAHKCYFFPEGGQMVTGLPAHLGFKAIGLNGMSIAVEGRIIDESGTQAVDFRSGFAGMGNCTFTPLPQHTYTAVVKYKDGSEEKISLPAAETMGYVLNIDNTDNKNISIIISAKGVSDDVMLIAQNNNQVQYAAKLKLINNIIKTTIAKKKFLTGIVQFTLFTSSSIPMAERLIFINHNDQLNVHTSLDKLIYGKREKVKLTLHVTDNLDEPVTGSFSIAVTDGNTEPLNKTNEHNITTNLLLTSDLKGYIENPNYYFTDTDSNKVKDLDNLLLTQGWRRFKWKEILADQFTSLSYLPEKSLAITGKAVFENGTPALGTKIMLLSKTGNGFTLEAQTDSVGTFVFNNLDIINDAQFVLQAEPKNGNKNVKITANSFSPPGVYYNIQTNQASTADSSLNKYILANGRRWEERMKSGMASEGTFTLEEVTVTTKKLSKVQQAVRPSYNLNGPGNADQVLTYDDIPNCHDLTQCLPGKLIGVYFKTVTDNNGVPKITLYSSSGQNKPMLIIVDGVDMPESQSSISNIPAHDVQSIEVLRSGAYLSSYGTRAAGGVLIITTKKGDIDYNHLDNKKEFSKGTLFLKMSGYTANREFYSPDYSSSLSNITTPDLRSTIHWQPNVVTDNNGNAVIEWYNADISGNYNIAVEGISNDGRIGNTFFTYQVK